MWCRAARNGPDDVSTGTSGVVFGNTDAQLHRSEPLDIEQLRERLRKMTDQQLLEFGERMCVYVLAGSQFSASRPREAFVGQ